MTSTTAETGSGRRTWSRLRNAGWLAVLVLGVVALWPASWGGIFGLTTVNGHSMEPTYHTGDLALTMHRSEYRIGEVISFQVPQGQPGAGGHVIHRVLTIDDTGATPVYTTKGDNNPAPDQWQIGPDDVTGATIFSLPGLGKALGGQTYGLMIGGAAGLIFLTLVWPSGKKPRTDS